eukprot:NODE_2839_length_1108_cov_24.156752_g2603_i0.p1 GENE.NODE_2839_length_1108_cov_24.156752_g2603_i0~~NODE_2839_length_1108_cov_24.156752_g2603_i0.p1  ORF type:complete len:352 (+),score=68.89 NODE_2839_length_1108_cov_24.156752_g2603_i0:107-1057(+)
MTAWIDVVARGAPTEAPCSLFLFHHAGGNPRDFHCPAFMSLPMTVYAVQLPGRGPRSAEPNCEDITAILDGLIPALLPHLDQPFAMVGFSMGALLAFECARCLKESHGKEASFFIAIAEEAPQVQKPFVDPQLGDDDFLAKLLTIDFLQGQDREVLSIGVPAIRADMRIEGQYVHSPDAPLLGCPMIGLCGSCDKWVTADGMSRWSETTSSSWDFMIVPNADHLFISSSDAMNVLQATILKWGRKTGFVKHFPKGEEELRQIERIEAQYPVKRIGQLWIKVDEQGNPLTEDQSSLGGLGAYLSKVSAQLGMCGYTV